MRRRTSTPEVAEAGQAPAIINTPASIDTDTVAPKPHRGRPPRQATVQSAVMPPVATPVTPAPKQLRRPRANATSSDSITASAPRRQRQKPSDPDTAAFTATLIEAVLKRCPTATALELKKTVAWALGVLAESEAIVVEASNMRKRGPRGPRNKATGIAAATTAQRKVLRQEKWKALDQRLQENCLNGALLECILEGKTSLTFENGRPVFTAGSTWNTDIER
jgi:hypothetical protein